MADEGFHPRGWEVVNPSCGDLHRRSSSTLLPAALRVGNEKDQTMYAVSIVVLGWCVGRKFFVFCCVPLQWYQSQVMRRCRFRSRIHGDVWVLHNIILE